LRNSSSGLPLLAGFGWYRIVCYCVQKTRPRHLASVGFLKARFLSGVVDTHRSNTQPEVPRCTFFLGHHLWPVQFGWPTISYCTAGLVLTIFWPHKPHLKFGANIFLSQEKNRPQIFWCSGRFISEDFRRYSRENIRFFNILLEKRLVHMKTCAHL